LRNKVQSIAMIAWKWPSFYSSCLVLGWRSAWPNCLKMTFFCLEYCYSHSADSKTL
jgi:hypothetical protein